MIPPLDLIAVEPTGTATIGLGAGNLRVTVNTYPPSERGQALRALRTAQGLSLGEGARWLGITVVQYSALERGGLTLSPEDWERASQRIRDFWRGP